MSLIRINKNPTPRQLLVFGAAWLLVVGLAGAAAWRRGHPALAETAWALAAAVPLAGSLSPGLLRGVFVGLSYASYPVGFAASYVVLALVYYAVLAPIGLAMRLFGYDPLTQRRNPGSTSLWMRRVDPKTPESYFRQY